MEEALCDENQQHVFGRLVDGQVDLRLHSPKEVSHLNNGQPLEANPVGVVLVVVEGILLEPLFVFYDVFVPKDTAHLNIEQEKHRVKDTSVEDEHFELDPVFDVLRSN